MALGLAVLGIVIKGLWSLLLRICKCNPSTGLGLIWGIHAMSSFTKVKYLEHVA
jgi:putative component of membrane protein insertase Oxa1/YidC/SpoIIIJ protein YidD